MKVEHKVVKEFLDENLKNHFEKRDYSILGTNTCYDAMGGRYTSYGLRHFDVPFLTVDNKCHGFYVLLRELIERVDNIIDGLVIAKKADKPEGAKIEDRDIIVDWRTFPCVEISDSILESTHISVRFRVSIHHK